MNYVGRYILLRAKVKDFAILELQVQPENKMIFVKIQIFCLLLEFTGIGMIEMPYLENGFESN